MLTILVSYSMKTRTLNLLSFDRLNYWFRMSSPFEIQTIAMQKYVESCDTPHLLPFRDVYFNQWESVIVYVIHYGTKSVHIPILSLYRLYWAISLELKSPIFVAQQQSIWCMRKFICKWNARHTDTDSVTNQQLHRVTN